MITLRVLGGADLRDAAGSPLEGLLRQPKRVALLTYLAIAEPAGFHRRDTLLLLFWPDLTQARARAALRKSLYVLRNEVGAETIQSRGDDELGIDWQHLGCDVTAFETALREGRTIDALELYRADLLTGFHLADGSPEWEHWLDGRRSELRHRAAAAASSHAAALAEAGNATEAIRWARWACTRIPDDEPALRRLLGLLGDLGDRAGALHLYDDFAARLRSDYRAQPAPETQALVTTIRARVAAAPPQVPPPTSPPVTPVAIPTSPPPASPTPASAPDPDAPSRRSIGRWRRIPIIATGLVAIAIVGWLLLPRRRKPVDPDLVAVAPFQVLTPGLEVWREGMVDLLTRNLDGAGPLRAVLPSRAIALVGDLESPAEAASRLGERTGAGVVVSGSLLSVGDDSIRVSAGVRDRRTEASLGSIEVRGALDRMDVVVDSLSRGILRAIGRVRQIGSVQHVSIGSVSVPAVREFLQGEQYLRRTAWDSARGHYERAVAFDTAFAMGWARLGLVNAMTHWPVPGGPAEEYIGLVQQARAGRFNQGLGKRDSLLVAAQSGMARILLGLDPPESAGRVHATAIQAIREFPDDAEAWTTLGAVEQYLDDQLGPAPEAGLARYERAMALDSGYVPPVRFAMQLAGALPDIDETRRFANRYLALETDPATRRIPTAIVALLDPGSTRESRAAMLDTTAVEALWPVFYTVYTLPDSQEATVQLARSLNARTHDVRYWFTAPFITRRNLAALLAYHGHLAEALEQAGTENNGWFSNLLAELAAFGAVPRRVADSTFTQWTRAELAHGLPDAVPWWAANRDTTAIQEFLAAHGGGDGEWLQGFLALARGDTARALEAFRATDGMTVLPRLTYLRLLVATGNDQEALRLARRRAPPEWPLPSQVALRMERARLEEAIGDPAAAAAGYRFVYHAWRHADPLLQPFVVEAREGLRRVEGEPP